MGIEISRHKAKIAEIFAAAAAVVASAENVRHFPSLTYTEQATRRITTTQ